MFFIGNVVKCPLIKFRNSFHRDIIKAFISTKSTDYNGLYSTNISQIEKFQSSYYNLYLLNFSSSPKSINLNILQKSNSQKNITKYDIECEKWC